MVENLTEQTLKEDLNLAKRTAVMTVERTIPRMDWINKRKTDVMQLVVMTRVPKPMVDMVSTLNRRADL